MSSDHNTATAKYMGQCERSGAVSARISLLCAHSKTSFSSKPMADEWNGTSFPLDDDRPLHRSGVDVDTATMVSIVSSAIILFSGCVAVVCLIVYMKKTESIRYRNCQPMLTSGHALSICAKCGATVALTPHLETKRLSSSVVVETMATSDNTQPPITVPKITPSERQMTANESALYAISSGVETMANKTDDSLLGFICGHISAQTTTYSTDGNDIHVHMRATTNDDIKRQALSCPSQCSSNHSELIRAYDFARRKHRMSFESVDIYESIGDGSDRETPTDPGIRQFTESPPKPNERRVGVVQHSSRVTADDAMDDSSTTTTDSATTTPTNDFGNDFFGALPRNRSRKPMWKLCSEADTLKCFADLKTKHINGLSDSDDDSRRRVATKKSETIDC